MLDDAQKPSEEKKKSIWERNKYLALLNDWAANATCFDGVPGIGRSEEWEWKLIWIVSFLAVTGYCAYSLSASLIEFFHYDVNTQISVSRKPSIEFPTVYLTVKITICNKDAYKIEESNTTDWIFSSTNDMVNSWISQGYDSLSVMTNANYNIKLTPYNLNITDPDYFYAIMSNYSYTLDDMLVSCMFNTIDCSKTEFFPLYTTTFGNCYQFNVGKLANGTKTSIMRTASAGRQNALKLELFIGYPSTFYDVIKSSGMQIFVHNSSYFPSFDLEGISVSAGFEYDAVIKQTYYNRQPKPYSDCVVDTLSSSSFNSALYRMTLSSVGRYNQKYCLQLCTQQSVLNSCQCWDITLPMPETTMPPCSINKTLTCVQSAYSTFYGSDDATTCFNDCPQECNSISFLVELSRADFPSPNYGQLMLTYAAKNPSAVRNLTSFDNIKSSVTAINLYYDDISYTEINESPARSAEQLMADVGGIVGLCIGASFLSIIELVELLYRVIYLAVNGDEAKTSHETSPEDEKAPIEKKAPESNLSIIKSDLNSERLNSRPNSRVKLITPRIPSSLFDKNNKIRQTPVESTQETHNY